MFVFDLVEDRKVVLSLKMERKSSPLWKSNDAKVSETFDILNINFGILKLNCLGFPHQSWIWMQQAMHPEWNYNSCFRKKWVC